jgi:hypothetical protein
VRIILATGSRFLRGEARHARFKGKIDAGEQE